LIPFGITIFNKGQHRSRRAKAGSISSLLITFFNPTLKKENVNDVYRTNAYLEFEAEKYSVVTNFMLQIASGSRYT